MTICTISQKKTSHREERENEEIIRTKSLSLLFLRATKAKCNSAIGHTSHIHAEIDEFAGYYAGLGLLIIRFALNDVKRSGAKDIKFSLSLYEPNMLISLRANFQLGLRKISLHGYTSPKGADSR